MIISQFALVYGTYLIATASPGPSNMAIMGTAMRDGRLPAMVLASGVVTGSLFWAILAATGVSAVLTAHVQALVALKIAGGLYLLYLAFRAGRSAMSSSPVLVGISKKCGPRPYRALYRQGLLMHMGNPKAIMAWVAIISLGIGQDASVSRLVMIVGGCVFLGVLVFGGYAFAFSTTVMIELYARARRWIEGVLSATFALAGLRLLTSPN
ncbi:LysE family translocator [Alcaligenes faecalis]